MAKNDIWDRLNQAERERDEARSLHEQMCANFGKQTSDMMNMSIEIDRLNEENQRLKDRDFTIAFGALGSAMDEVQNAEACIIDDLRHLSDETINRLAMGIIAIPMMGMRKLVVRNVILALADILEEKVG